MCLLIMFDNVCCPYFTLEQVFWDVFHQIIAHEFGALVTERLLREIVLRSVKHRSARLERKQNALADVNTIRTERAWEWPMPVSKEVIFECLNGYMKGTMWTKPPYDRGAADVRLSGDISSLNLDLLRVSDDFVIKKNDGRDANGSRAYQLILRHMQLLPCAAYTKKALHDLKGKRKAAGELQGQSPAKTSKMPAKSRDIFDMELETDEEYI
ncbi:uncharacterized protein EDB91DRAFT_1333499 [Suillus paluster]|uniref:uncharacterized protein n=1 Tax=Suillus paluster TaxID=48578 RepID=UPI001B86B0EF|nr:uncharacterized protein EDB91DRAFT_1333499 [Suillus paluster]KAG1752559.1 hypothetical protein EDB91DRAFT_1333499 [Suillus paluster]